jgi:hypothetical protein
MYSSSELLAFLVTTIVTGRNGNVPGAPLLSLLSTLDAFPNAIGGGLRWCCPTAVGGDVE